MSTYKTTPCCGKSVTKETSAACCNCPVSAGEFFGNFNLSCGQQETVFFINEGIAPTLNGSIEVAPESDCGVNVVVTSNGNDIPFSIGRPCNPDSIGRGNSRSFVFKNVTQIEIICNGDGMDSCCVGNYFFTIVDSCVTATPIGVRRILT
ncbi:S-Ena type endospore appendage [Cytobacillus sp. IB215316]|uniref:S-Ena type endospore appendage n=1 Tax=Cytobacillus sp. IB215316 TaxID=3097354 RepID=UPI002A146FB9|nr:S-Ena type endospore appendage [Cytobacillus sp. IB215316]MDX8360697.1 S-Ena type endospore appendage [Cytobacillus sp. IB215316]